MCSEVVPTDHEECFDVTARAHSDSDIKHRRRGLVFIDREDGGDGTGDDGTGGTATRGIPIACTPN